MTHPVPAIVRPRVAPVPQPGPAGREFELKFQLPAPAFQAAQHWHVLAAGPPRPRARRLHSVYFDTAQGDLGRNGVVLRLRTQGRRHVLTFKWNGTFPGGPFERGEVEAVAASPDPDPAALGAEVATAIAALTEGRALQPAYATDIRRIARRITTGTSEIEVAFDTGVITAGELSGAVHEIEMELKSGDPADLYTLGISFAAAFPARLGCLSKSERGALLRSGTKPPVVRATTVLAATPTVDEAIGTLVTNCIGQFIGNWPAFEAGDRVGAVHQMRVAMRRLRSVLGLFQRSFPGAEFPVFRNQARAIAAAMAEARNWDVFIALVRHGPAAAFPDEPGFATLLDAAEERRAAGHDAVHTLLAAADTTRFVLSLQAFVARRGWRNALADDVLPRLAAPALEYAGTALARLHRKLLKRGKGLGALSPQQRHDVRKELKRLRYMVDPFGGLFDNPKQVASYTRAVSALQDQLGRFNDLVVAQDLVARLETRGDPAASRAAGIIMGWCGHGAAADAKAGRTAWKNFRKAKLFA